MNSVRAINGMSVVIATFNRANTLSRAINSALGECTNHLPIDVVVVNDASSDETEAVVERYGADVQYVRNKVNLGPGPCRNLGIAAARYPWIVILDDDDELVPGGVSTIRDRISGFSGAETYPVFFFASSNARVHWQFKHVAVSDLLGATFRGDLVPIINRDALLKNCHTYPDVRIGGEGLLWLDVAERHPIPTWADIVILVHADGSQRLTSAANQIRRACEYAELQELHIEKIRRFGNSGYRGPLAKRHLGAVTYRLLAGDRERARLRLSQAAGVIGHWVRLCFFWLTYLPRPMIVYLFRAYRGLTNAGESFTS